MVWVLGEGEDFRGDGLGSERGGGDGGGEGGIDGQYPSLSVFLSL